MPLCSSAEETLQSEAAIYCQQVSAGAKPVASMQLDGKYLDGILSMCRAQGVLTIVATNRVAPDWVTVFIYKRQFLKAIIEHSLNMTDHNAVEIFFRGCMYGYDMAAIEEMVGLVSKGDTIGKD
jgi:hypothetical protein